ncbi:MAG: hypothetical protein AB8B55_08850 [Mariniblastus sp.]
MEPTNFTTIIGTPFFLAAGIGEWETMLTAWSIRLAMLCLVATLALRLSYSFFPLDNDGLEKEESNPPPTGAAKTIREGAKSLWLIGSFLSLFHAAAAMGFYHGWSHLIAVEDTARQTKALLGVSVGVGVYFNYVFVAVWMLDAFWWTASERVYESRPRWLHRLVYGFIIFIAINGAIVFETGWVRWAGIGCCFGLLLIYWMGNSQKPARVSQPN